MIQFVDNPSFLSISPSLSSGLLQSRSLDGRGILPQVYRLSHSSRSERMDDFRRHVHMYIPVSFPGHFRDKPFLAKVHNLNIFSLSPKGIGDQLAQVCKSVLCCAVQCCA